MEALVCELVIGKRAAPDGYSSTDRAQDRIRGYAAAYWSGRQHVLSRDKKVFQPRSMLSVRKSFIKMSTPETNQEFDEEQVPEISHALQPEKTLQESNPPLVNTPPAVIHQPLEQSVDAQPNIVDVIFKKGINFEKLIGENLINKLGIAITIIAVAIGAKYSIDNNLINPMTRIILGYLMGIGLLGVGMKLKQNYHNFSAVLVRSGAIAIMYFITYAAYSFYGLFSMEVAFGLMLMFTVFTVVTAIHYDKQVVAHIGLVGAYAVPFLFSEGTGKVGVLFTYMVIINLGILVLAFKKYWKALYLFLLH